MTKWIFGALLGLFFSQPVVANEALEYEIELTDENGNVHSQSVMLDVRNGEAYFEGDIFVGYVLEDGTLSETPYEQNNEGQISPFSIISTNNLWGTTVPYSLAGLTPATSAAVRQAMDTLESISGLNFVVRSNQADYIVFEYSSGGDAKCSSPIGRRGGAQKIRLAPYCSDSSPSAQRTIMHELMHSLGFYHEHSRNDRDSYIVVHFDNIKEGAHSQFRKITSDFEYLTPYDKRSIMHYRRYTGSSWLVIDSSQPILSDKNNPNAPISGVYLSDLDIQGLQSRFGYLQSTNLVALPLYCYGQVELVWDAVPTASKYKVYYGNGELPHSTPYTLTTTEKTSLMIWTATDSRVYSVSACNEDGQCGNRSNQEYVHYYSYCM